MQSATPSTLEQLSYFYLIAGRIEFDCFDRLVYSHCGLCNKTWLKFPKSFCFYLYFMSNGTMNNNCLEYVCSVESLHVRSFIDHFTFVQRKHNIPSNNAINNGSACSVLFLSMTGLFSECRKFLEHQTQSKKGNGSLERACKDYTLQTYSKQLFFIVKIKTNKQTLKCCLLRLDCSHK